MKKIVTVVTSILMTGSLLCTPALADNTIASFNIYKQNTNEIVQPTTEEKPNTQNNTSSQDVQPSDNQQTTTDLTEQETDVYIQDPDWGKRNITKKVPIKNDRLAQTGDYIVQVWPLILLAGVSIIIAAKELRNE